MNDISIIVPVFNKELFIEQCLDSIFKQKTTKRIELICVDDGSTDSSEIKIKQAYAKHEKNKLLSLNYFKKYNGGVSSARNYGLSHASGRYLLFLDADDYISDNTVEDLVNYFDKIQSEADLLTYNIFYEKNGKIKKGKRGDKYKSNCLIDLNAEADFSQSTMNVCIKNGLGITFDENIPIGEDQLFNTTILSQKKKIGWCNTAKYFYRRNASSTDLINHPYYAEKNIIYFFSKLLELGNSTNFSKYCQSLILYNLAWRIQGDYLFNYFTSNGEQKLPTELESVINKIDAEIILKNRWLIRDHKHFLLSLKKIDRPFVIVEPEGLCLCDSRHGQLLSEKKVGLIVQRERFRDEELQLMGFLKCDCVNYICKPKLFIYLDDIKKEVPLYLSNNSHFASAIKTNMYFGFDHRIKLRNNLKIKFTVLVDEIEYDVSYWFRPWSAISTDRKNFKDIGSKYKIELKGDFIQCQKAERMDKIKIDNVVKKISLGKWFIRKISTYLKSHFKIWIYIDAKGYFDNAFIQFKHDIKKKDGILNFYVCEEKPSNEMITGLSIFDQFFIIKRNSLIHRILFIACDKIFTSFFEHSMFVPYTKSYKDYADIIRFEGIYLQHGVMHAKLDHMYSKDVSYFIDKIVVSTNFEAEIAERNLHFKENEILKTGMPRYSTIQRKQGKGNLKKIIYAPSWRKYMLNHKGPDNWETKNIQDKESVIYAIDHLLQNKRLEDILERHNLYLDVKLHRNFDGYKNQIQLRSERIKLKSEVNPNEYCLCITDISSFVFDFIYLNIPILKYVPDWDKIVAGLHSYRQFNYDFDKVGDVAKNEDEFFEKLCQIIETDFKPNYDREKIFLKNIDSSTIKIYEEVKQCPRF